MDGVRLTTGTPYDVIMALYEKYVTKVYLS